VRHVSEGTLRRLLDEPLAISDYEGKHVASCERCRRLRERVAADARRVGTSLARPFVVPDVDRAWHRHQATVAGGEADPPGIAASAPAAMALERVRIGGRRLWRLAPRPVPRAAVLVTVAVLLAGGAAGLATALSSSPKSTTAAASPGIEALASFSGLDGTGVIGGFSTRSGTRRLPAGVLRWSSSGRAHDVATMAEAERQTGLTVASPAHLPSGVGAIREILVQPEVTATMTFGSGAGSGMSGKSLTLTAGPAVLVEYGGSFSLFGLPSLATFVMARPLAAAGSSGAATAARLEAYVLSEPGVPLGFEQEVRLVADLGTVLPLPMPSGAHMSQVDVDGAPAILVTDASVGASGVLWQDHAVVRAAVGLLDRKDLLDVAGQLG
jgi:hypothetical protein